MSTLSTEGAMVKAPREVGTREGACLYPTFRTSQLPAVVSGEKLQWLAVFGVFLAQWNTKMCETSNYVLISVAPLRGARGKRSKRAIKLLGKVRALWVPQVGAYGQYSVHGL